MSLSTARCRFHAREILHSSISKALSSLRSSTELRKVHALVITAGFDGSAFLTGKLISKYARFREPTSCISVFDRVSPTNNAYPWNSIIRALTQNGLFSEAVGFYSRMRDVGVRPDAYTFPSVINACAGLGDAEMGKVVHRHVSEEVFGSDLYIGNALIDMYARLDDMGKACGVFEEMSHRDVVSWNSLISGYSSNQYWEEALWYYGELKMDGILPDLYTVSSVLPACGGLVAVREGRTLHGLVEKIGVDGDVIVRNGLLSMYFKFGNVTDAQKVFDEMVFRDIVSWNTLVCGYCQLGLFEHSIKLFREMITTFTPDLLTFASVLRACGHLGDLELGTFIHDYSIRKGMEFDTRANNILLDMYAKGGDLLAAHQLFNTMKDRDSVSWNSLLNGYILHGSYWEAMQLFKNMKMEDEPDSITHVMLLSLSTQFADIYLGEEVHCHIVKSGFTMDLRVCNALIDMYAKCSKLEDSLRIFGLMNVHDIVTWNTIISACIHHQDCYLGFQMINAMRNEGLVPDEASLLGILPVCSLLAAKQQGKEIHGYIFRLGFESNVPVGNAMIEMYSKCGNLKSAVGVFELMKVKDVVTWTALISAYGMYGEGQKALKAFAQMEIAGIHPDHVAFIAIIFACSHSGLVEEGLNLFDCMKTKYNIEPKMEHYACTVDLLSRSGHLAKAEDFILSMPMKPDASIWGALLSACRANGNMKIAERVSKRIIELDTDMTGYNVLVSNVYASMGKWEQVRSVRKSIRSKGLKKSAGCSWMEINKRVYIFGTGDRFFEQFEEVYQLLDILGSLMAKQGYVPDLQCVLHDVDDDEKRDMLCGHSERLAIAFGLLNTKPGSPLQIMKNLRVCADCHTVSRYISNIVQREILVRDANRFHLFKNGACSCNDRW
ncbi:hypothetical protein BT93_G0742 [Corymbia citriodora subsp. variegata]|nr:hypothetical protein BT93_G0742 [Corymbia citriodora subsp. variegata]